MVTGLDLAPKVVETARRLAAKDGLDFSNEMVTARTCRIRLRPSM